MPVLDCVIIGAGQAGLCFAKYLKDLNRSFVILERDKIGSAWLKRPVDMKLFTSRQFCGLPGLSFPGDKDGFPLVAEVAAYLQNYARELALPVKERACVVGVKKNECLFTITLENGDVIESKSLVNATGSNQVCEVPTVSKDLDSGVTQLIAENQSFDAIADTDHVVVVGDGASGRQIAGLLAARCRAVTIATGTPRGLPPNRILGKDIFWWLNKLGVLFADRDSLVAKVLKKRNPVPCKEFNNLKLEKLGVSIQPRMVSCSEKTVTFSNQSSCQVDAIVWATGYSDATEWLQIENSVVDGKFEEKYGVCPEPGLFLVGRKWLSCRASELIMGVERDVKLVIPKLSQYLESAS